MINTVIFDMDGLLIDSEPLWEKAGIETMQHYGVQMKQQDYHLTTGLRTAEWIDYWFTRYQINAQQEVAVEMIITKAIEYIFKYGEALPGVAYIMDYFHKRNFKIGLATSSPMNLVEVVTDKLKIHPYLQAISSAEHLPYGKPHPLVYLNCAEQLHATPMECICFEDSFNGMIAAKAARMKCVVIPAPAQQQETRWNAADLKISSLQNFNDLLLETMF